LCAALPRVETRTEIVIVRHVLETHMTSNTGRLSALALSNCSLIDYGGGPPFDSTCLKTEGSWLLYPGPHANPSLPPPQRIVVLDASFHQARRMYRRIPALHGMPELALPPPAFRIRLRQPTRADGMSTIEAIAAALLHLGEADAAHRLFDLYDLLVRRCDELRGRKRDLNVGIARAQDDV
jgi:DTW domain-containing protein YfiP